MTSVEHHVIKPSSWVLMKQLSKFTVGGYFCVKEVAIANVCVKLCFYTAVTVSIVQNSIL